MDTSSVIMNKKTVKYGVAGGIMGACLGIPGLGMVAGMAHANKDKIKQWSKSLDENGGI